VQQEQYLAKAKDDWHYDASNIRRCLTAEAINAKYALFPLSDYPTKYIVRDLFSEDVRLTNVELFHEMQRKLQSLPRRYAPSADNEARNEPAWAGLRRSFPNYIGANTLFDDKLEHPESKPVRFPGRTAFERMSWDDVMGLVRLVALATLQLMYQPDPAAARELETAGVEWFRYDAAFLSRFRLDALQDLARHLKVESDGLKKGQLVAAILAHEDRPFLPVKWNERRRAEQAG
jgi:hypothetical protein